MSTVGYAWIQSAVEAPDFLGKVVARVDLLIDRDLLAPSQLDDWRRGKGARQRLRFTKSGDAKLEQAYATHFVWPGGGPFQPPGPGEPRE